MKNTSGTLLYRCSGHELQVLLVHPSGNYNRRAPWSIPKGEPDEGETLEQAARRETLEETGVVAGALVPLGHVGYKKSRKRIHCFAGPAPADAAPRCASWEVDRSEFIPIDEARRILHPDLCEFLDRLEQMLAEDTDQPVYTV